jgi:hypothetical protein
VEHLPPGVRGPPWLIHGLAGTRRWSTTWSLREASGPRQPRPFEKRQGSRRSTALAPVRFWGGQGLFAPADQWFAEGQLARKWTMVARLQKRIMELEKGVSSESSRLGGVASRKDFLPKSTPAHTLEGHRGAVLGVAVHPSHMVVATCGEDCAVRVWDGETGSPLASLRGHTAPVTAVAFDPSGDTLCEFTG